MPGVPPCCCEPPAEKCGTIINDLSCGPYQGFLLGATPCAGGALVNFYGTPDEWEMVSCACSEDRKYTEQFYTINGTCYKFTSINAIAHFPFNPGGGCVDIDTTGATLIESFECPLGCVETMDETFGPRQWVLHPDDADPVTDDYYTVGGICVKVVSWDRVSPCPGFPGPSGDWEPTAGPFPDDTCSGETVGAITVTRCDDGVTTVKFCYDATLGTPPTVGDVYKLNTGGSDFCAAITSVSGIIYADCDAAVTDFTGWTAFVVSGPTATCEECATVEGIYCTTLTPCGGGSTLNFCTSLDYSGTFWGEDFGQHSASSIPITDCSECDSINGTPDTLEMWGFTEIGGCP